MNRVKMQPHSANGSKVGSTAKTRLSGYSLIIARTAWMALVIPGLGITLFSFPLYYQQILKPCVDAMTCNIPGAMTAKGLQALVISGNAYATFQTIFWAAIFAIWSGTGLLIYWRRSDDGMALLAAFFLVMFNTGTTASALAVSYPAVSLPVGLMNFLGQLSFWLFLFLFPNGRLVPRWMGLFIPLALIQAIWFVAPPISPFNGNTWPGWLHALIALTVPGAIIFSQIYRYSHASNTVERQQTKWVAFAIGTVVGGFIVFGLLFNVIVPAVTQSNSVYTLFQFVYPLLLLSIPISIGIAILRYRLYDIDLFINRTLVYATLSVLLTLVYFSIVIGLETLVRLLTGQALQSPLIIVASTLAIAALFRPLRRRLQKIIDRRFYRHKYDAARTLAAFSATLRNEVDVNQLREHLLAVVEETMHPAHVSLWLRQDEKRNTSHPDAVKTLLTVQAPLDQLEYIQRKRKLFRERESSMNLSNIHDRTTSNLSNSGIAKTHLSGLKLILARTIWLVLVIPSLALTIVSFPVYYQQLGKPCVDVTTCNIPGAMKVQGLQGLAALGVSVPEYAIFTTLFWAIVFTIWCGMGLLVFWRRSDDGMALLGAFLLVLFPTGTRITSPEIIPAGRIFPHFFSPY